MTSEDDPAKLRRRVGSVTAALLICLLPHCLVSGERCDENQERGAGQVNACVCVEGTVPDPRGYGCTPCGENETAVGSECRCVEGFERKSSSAPCVEAESGSMGAACDEASDCSAQSPYCARAEDAGYCTTAGCKMQDACPTNWRCETSEDGSFCAQPPKGLGQPCTSQDDCADTQATYCDRFYTNQCYIEKCVTGEQQCPSGSVCCDVRSIVSTSICVPTNLLQGGLCPDGNAPVPQ